MSSENFKNRYLAGECEIVWEELLCLGEIIEPSLRADALTVARETMQRARFNINTVINRLKKFGFEFAESDLALVVARSSQIKKFCAFV